MVNLTTDRNESFLLENYYENHIIIFDCKTNVDTLKTATLIMIKETFDYCSQSFLQLFTVFLNGHFVPVLFCLLLDKKEKIFALLLSKISIVIGNGVKDIMVDFDIAIHKALRTVWPGAKIFECRFHLTQSW